uniref:Ig-like domain-containing protein n=1 Tax=Timema cristinae TaxID=61476 RepID=A0A7R9CHD4_TIMCR|nr:unnamed protein product [Timema cristinae]
MTHHTFIWVLFLKICDFTYLVETQTKSYECPSACSCLGEFIDCSKQDIVELPKDLPVWVENLDLSANLLRDNATDGLGNLSFLTDLKLSKNFLSRIPNLSNSNNVTYLSVSHNDISAINGSPLIDLPNLATLDLSNNQVTDIKVNNFLFGSNIHTLNLNNNRIISIEKGSLDNLGKLVELKLNRNHLSRFNKELFKHLKYLKVLDLNKNKFTEIEGLSFHGLEGLNILKLKHNSIVTLLDGAFWGLKNMTVLHLDFNNITTVTKGWLYGLTSLHQLSLSYNSISIIEQDGWEFCQQLVDLDLSHNKLEAIQRGTLQHLSKLKKLHLDSNKISYIAEGAFNNTPSLEVLELNHNRISWTIEDVNGAFISLKHLVKFGLASNHIKSINKNAFAGLEKIKMLDLRNNSVTSIQENAFEWMYNMEELLMNTTGLLCDCNLEWFPIWLKKSAFLNTVNTVCAYPEWLHHKSIVDVPSENFTCDDFPKPQIIEAPKTQVALKGDNITLHCRATSSSHIPMAFQWKKDNLDLKLGYSKQFARSPNGKTTEQNSELVLVNITDNEAGKYQCVVSNSYGTTYSSKFKISVLVYPMFTKVPVNVSEVAGSNARLECAATGQPPPQIAWQKDAGTDFPAARERRMHIMRSDDILFIVNIKAADTGVYSCTAKNQAGIIVANASLTVLEKPLFVKPMENKEVTAGEPIVLECMTSGSPKPKLTWTKDGGPLFTTERHFFTAEDQLLIIVATDPSDAGTYECEMTNKLGTQKGFSRLYVIPETDFKDSAPHLYMDTNSEHSSSKDSGTGDSAKRSSDDLLLENRLALALNGDSRQSLVIENCELDISSVPLRSNTHRTDHDRCIRTDSCMNGSHRWSAPHCGVVSPITSTKQCSYNSLPKNLPTLLGQQHSSQLESLGGH